jgi:predicted Rossmann-fold nucleotide-binding protein
MAIAEDRPKAVAVYCASTLGKQPAYRSAAICEAARNFLFIYAFNLLHLTALGTAIAKADRSLVYGGGTQGIMGLVASSVLKGGSSVTGIVPFAISIAGGEGTTSAPGVEGELQESSARVETVGAIMPFFRPNAHCYADCC